MNFLHCVLPKHQDIYLSNEKLWKPLNKGSKSHYFWKQKGKIQIVWLFLNKVIIYILDILFTKRNDFICWFLNTYPVWALIYKSLCMQMYSYFVYTCSTWYVDAVKFCYSSLNCFTNQYHTAMLWVHYYKSFCGQL